MGFLFDIDLAISSDAWVAQANEIMKSNRSSAFKFNDAFVVTDFRSYCGESTHTALNKWLAGVGNSPEGYDVDGEFAIAAVFPMSRKVVLARDWSGVGNVFYTIEGNRLIVGSNVYQVVSSRHDRKFSLVSCAEYLVYEYVAEPKTLFDGVFCVLRGKTVMVDSSGKITVKGCNNLIPSAVVENEVSSGLREHITRAHQKRIGQANGIYLSGGIDSTVMAIALKRDLGLDRVHAFTFRTIGAEQDESGEAENVAKQLGLVYDCVSVDPTRSVDLPDMINRSNFPYSGAIFLGSIADRIRDAGLNGITLFAGQDTRLHTPPYIIIDRLILYHFLDSRFIRQILKMAGCVTQNIFRHGRIHKGGVRLSMGSDLSAYVARYLYHCHQLGITTPGGRLAAEQLCAAIDEKINFGNSSREVFNDIVSIAWDRQYTSDIAYMAGVTRSYGNHCSMPFYDRDLANYSASIPMGLALKTTVGRAGHSGVKKRVNKFVLREAYKKDLTPHMIFRDKAVCVSNHLYLNGCMSGYVSDLFHAPLLRDTELGQQLNLGPLYQRGIDKNGRWTMQDYEQVVETQNLLFLEIIAYNYGIQC